MKTIVITGASDGIGAQAARQLARQGHRLLLVGRTEAKLAAVAAEVGVEECFVADFERLGEVRRLARDLRAATDRIDVLVNNAGGSFTGPVITEDGFERTFQVNYVAGFLLTLDLMEILTASQGAVVNTSSRAATKGTVDLGDLDGRQRFKTYRAYQDVKLASTLHIRELHARYHDQGLSAMAFNPGFIGGTSVGAEPFPILTRFNRAPLTWIFPSLSWGGARLAYFAEGTPGQAWQSGCYYRDDHRLRHTAKQAYDPQLSRQLWDTTIELLAHQGIVFAG